MVAEHVAKGIESCPRRGNAASDSPSLICGTRIDDVVDVQGFERTYSVDRIHQPNRLSETLLTSHHMYIVPSLICTMEHRNGVPFML